MKTNMVWIAIACERGRAKETNAYFSMGCPCVYLCHGHARGLLIYVVARKEKAMQMKQKPTLLVVLALTPLENHSVCRGARTSLYMLCMHDGVQTS